MDFSTGSEVSSDDVATAATGSKAVHAPRFDVKTDAKRDALLTEFGKDTLRDRYLLPGEGYQDLFARVAAAYSDNAISPNCGSCRRRRCCPTAAPGAACRSVAI
jgi:ribonucleoside-diphosphate reductase alpha chain